MTDSAPSLPASLAGEFDSVVLQMFAAVDTRTSLNGDCSIKVELQLIRKISQLSREHRQIRNSQQAVFRLPLEVLVQSMSSLSVENLLSVIRVCRRLRTSACDTSSLWTQVHRIEHPSALRFVLERANGLPVSITSLRVYGTEDDRLRVIAGHMSHVYALGIRINTSFGKIMCDTPAYILFTTPAPLLQRLSFSGVEVAGDIPLQSIQVPALSMYGPRPLFSGIAPLLNALYVRGVQISADFSRRLPELELLRTFSFGLAEKFSLPEAYVRNIASTHCHHVTTFNIELADWVSTTNTGGFPPALQRINIRWTKPAPLVPADVVPQNPAWNSIHVIHITHVCDIPHGTSNISATSLVAIPATSMSYCTLEVRQAVVNSPRMHVRAVDAQNRERIFCGLQPAAVAGMAARMSAERLSQITLSTTAISFGVFSNARCPVLRRIHLVSDTCDMGWVDAFARDFLNVTTIQRIDFSADINEYTNDWSTVTILRVLACCMAAGSVLEQVGFLGFEPEARCVSQAAVFTDQVTVERDWKEHPDERIWFTQPSFDWM